MSIRYFDAARQMMDDLSNDESIDGCHLCVVVILKKDGVILQDIVWDDDSPHPFTGIGALECVKQELMDKFIETDNDA